MKSPSKYPDIRSLAVAAIGTLLLSTPAFVQESLPFPPKPSGSKAGPSIAESTYSPLPAKSHLPANAPNIVVIMLDDVGPALPEAFGGPIATPTLSRLAQQDRGRDAQGRHQTRRTA